MSKNIKNRVLLRNEDFGIGVETVNLDNGAMVVITDSNENEIELSKDEFDIIVALEQKSNKLSEELSQGN